jgi:transposase-like protein
MSSTPESEKKLRKSFTTEFKRNVVNFYNNCKSKHKTAAAFNIDRASVILWVKKETDIARRVDGRPSAFSLSPVQLTVHPQSRRLVPVGKTVMNVQMEEQLKLWFDSIRSQSKNNRVTREMISRKAKKLNTQTGGGAFFSASKGWCDRFLTRFVEPSKTNFCDMLIATN